MFLELTVYPVQEIRELQFRERPCVKWGEGMMGVVEEDNLAYTHTHMYTHAQTQCTHTNMDKHGICAHAYKIEWYLSLKFCLHFCIYI